MSSDLSTITKTTTESPLDVQKYIFIKGARSNNLKNIDVQIPKNQLIVVTGLSGSGKSSLIMETLYAEGQRRYVESLSAYARQFLSRMKKPEVDYIKGICPAIAIEQKVSSSNARSTVGSLTEVYDYLRLLYARIGLTYSPVSGNLVTKHTVTDVIDFILSHDDETKISVYSPLSHKYRDRTLEQEFNLLIQKGYTRILYKGNIEYIEEMIDKIKTSGEIDRLAINILIDRFSVSHQEENRNRMSDSVLTAFSQGEGECYIQVEDHNLKTFNNRFELDGMDFIEPVHHLFNYNNPYGACPKCQGYGQVIGIDPSKVMPDPKLSIYENGVVCWRGEKFGKWKKKFVEKAHLFDFPIHRPIGELSEEEMTLLWNGNKHFRGIQEFFDELEEQTYKIQNRVMLARYRGKTKCPECRGGRLRKEASYVKVDGHSIDKLIHLPIYQLSDVIETLSLSDYQKEVASRILLEISNRLKVMVDVGLGYLTLDRVASSLSGGETQRINLTKTLGSNLTSSLYILDEPSIGLHPKDTANLIRVIRNLKDLGNTVIVVEHEEEIIKQADYIIDIGPLAGVHGGEVVFSGSMSEFVKADAGINSLTLDYYTQIKSIPLPERRRKGINKISVRGANMHNLKGINVEIPLNTLTVVTGVSGSGKSTLVKHVLYPALIQSIAARAALTADIGNIIEGDLRMIDQVELINQSPIGKSSRSNPVTYVKAFDEIRNLMASQQMSKIRGYQSKHFSFNTEGGRCENCKGEGEITVEMQFLADIKLVCEDCKGRRYTSEVLEVTYQDKNIFEILDLTVEEAVAFFDKKKRVVKKLKPLLDVGMGYVKLGQPSSTLSGGEAQRVKLASYLSKEKLTERIFFIFDEPSTGLHFHDIAKLLDALNALVEKGHTVLVVEHNMDIIKCADWLIDLGPDGGRAGGYLLYQGNPEGLSAVDNSYTGQYLKDKL